MAKRKRHQGAEPTLFDLPLHGPDSGEAEAESRGISGAALAASERATHGPSRLREGTRTGDGGQSAEDDAQLELSEPATAGDELIESGAGSAATARADDPAFLGDRLLGGLADLAAQLTALGSAVAAAYWLGVAVTVADWQPFGILAVVFSFLYWIVPLAFWGQTPGMAWVGQTARSTSGEPLSFGQTILRWLGAVLTLALAGLPMLLALTGRSLTDRISGSRTTATG